jgi:putative endonuclease
MKSYNKIIGDQGETQVVNYIKKNGYSILAQNYSINKKIGEIDIIAKKNIIIAFIEVKKRKKNHHILINELISKKKQIAIIKMALIYCKEHSILISDYIIRFDMAYIVEETLNYYENAFTLS